MRRLKPEFQNILPKETEARLSEFCTNAAEIVSCMNYAGLQNLKKELAQVKKHSQHPEVVYLIELLEFYKKNSIPLEPYTQIMLNLELLYIRFYMIQEIIARYKKLPKLAIGNVKLFRLVFTHESSEFIFFKKKPFVYFINWFKPDLSEICYRFFDFDGKNQRDEVMCQGKNIQTFQDWYDSVYV